MLYNEIFVEYETEIDTLIKDTFQDSLYFNHPFFDYLKNQISNYALQRLLTLLITQLSNEDQEAYTDLNRHLMSYKKDLTMHNEYEYVPLSEITKDEEILYKLDDNVKKEFNLYNRGYKSDSKISLQRQKYYVNIIDSYNYTLSTKFDYNSFLKLDPTLLHWHLQKKNFVPSLYSFYLNILSNAFKYTKKSNLFYKCNSIVENSKSVGLDTIDYDSYDLIDKYNKAISYLNEYLKYDDLLIIIKNNQFIEDNFPTSMYDMFYKSLYYNYVFLLNNLYANHFFNSLNSKFFSNISSYIDIPNMNKSKELTYLKINTFQFLNFLELLATFDIDMHRIDNIVQSVYDTCSLACTVDLNQVKNYISNIERYKTINSIIEEFVFDLHIFLLKSIECILKFCNKWNEVAQQFDGDEKTHTILDLISQIHDILKDSYNTTQTFKEIQFQDIQTCFQTKSEKCILMYLLHYLSIHRDLQDRLLHY